KLKQFENYLRNHTRIENLGIHLNELFEALNTAPTCKVSEQTCKVLETLQVSEQTLQVLQEFPYVNGGLFSVEITPLPAVNVALRETLIKCCEYDWSFISPVIFGSLFQAVISEKDRRNLGAHYTSERNIMRVVKPLFLDQLHTEFETAKQQPETLELFR
ncbi:MAG TPA: hypothetical protein DCQ31_05435, partial [Bacteroidales bacterium]|nr:hypothetical protein [Bacteroidales bacterium]